MTYTIYNYNLPTYAIQLTVTVQSYKQSVIELKDTYYKIEAEDGKQSEKQWQAMRSRRWGYLALTQQTVSLLHLPNLLHNQNHSYT